jgi:AraC-like DNA-binding protein
MQPRYEAIDAGREASFVCRTFSGSGWKFAWHLHPEYELTLITRGSGQRFVGDHIGDFRPGDLVLLGPNLPHTWYSRPPITHLPHSATIIQFLGACLGDGFFDRPELTHVKRLLDQSAHGLQFTGRSAVTIAKRIAVIPALSPLARLTELLAVLDQLARSHGAVRLSSRAFDPPARREQRRIERVLRFVNENFTRDLSIAEVAQLTHLSESAFSRFFHHHSGKPFTRYVNELRVGRACELLAGTDRNIAVLAMDCGFKNLSNFNRRFRELRGVQPRDYRAQFQAGGVM